jgi:membrane protein YqaA with SNARE-associated domain
MTIKTMMRWGLGVVLGFTSLTSLAASGVAFVHGTGSQTDAYNDYWTGDFVQSVMQKQSNPNNYVMINCDFDQYMWDSAAAGCLAGQLTTYIQNNNITDLYVITHSNGGNVVRWIMSNPTWDNRYPAIINAISQVNAIAASSAGTPLADAAMNGNVFESTLGWILGYKSDAVRMQQESWMASYNTDWLYGTSGRPSLPKPFWTIIGSDVDSAIWDSDSYCGGYQYQLALETTQNWLDNCSDGFLECSSQRAAGNEWFTDKEVTAGSEPLSHHQSRRDCFGLDVILRNDI